ncbi:MAG: CYTH domain-containing protein [Microbacterium sp.]|uniref:CYTH domain-containing protein n=1 Tax=Microbacterium sp. TaxID=51671 RepID=UPI0039E5DA16
MSGDEPTRSLEVERSYDVGDDAVVPDWSLLPGVAAVGGAEVRELDARYLDTADLTLGRAGIALRRRTGGPDEGWHVKIAAAEGRHEYHWPLGDEALPAGIAEALAPWAEPPFTPLARIRNRRVAYALTDAAGHVVAEMVDDHVTATDERTGRAQRWREWEVELGPAAPADAAAREAFFAAVEALVADAGGRPAASDSKLARTLGR